MTVAIAICTKNAVVLASDSMGSSGEIASSVVKVRSESKLSLSWATAGTDFLTQTVEASIRALDDTSLTPQQVADQLSTKLRTAYDVPVVRPSTREADVHRIESLIVGFAEDRPSIIHLPDDLAAVECRDRSFVAIGSGHNFAHVCKTLLSNYFNNGFDLESAKLMAYRIVSTVCSVSSWGVAPPVQLAWVTAQGSEQATPAELERLEVAIQGWVEVEAATFDHINPQDADMPGLGSPRVAVL